MIQMNKTQKMMTTISIVVQMIPSRSNGSFSILDCKEQDEYNEEQGADNKEQDMKIMKKKVKLVKGIVSLIELFRKKWFPLMILGGSDVGTGSDDASRE